VLSDGGTFTDAAAGVYLRQISHSAASVTLDVQIRANVPTVVPVFTAISLSSGGTLTLTATGAASQVYWLLGASDLAPSAAWTPLATNTASADGVCTFSPLDTTSAPRRYYRLRTP